MANYSKEEIKNFAIVYDEISKILNTEKTYQKKIRELKLAIQSIMDKNSQTLNSYILGRRLLINEKETNKLMEILGISKKEVDAIMDKSPVFDQYSADTKRKPMYLNLPLLVFAIDLYKLKKVEDSYFVYFIMFLRAYASKIFLIIRNWSEGADTQAMQYTVEYELDGRYDLKKYGSILDTLMKSATASFEHYMPDLGKDTPKDMFMANDVITSGIYTRTSSWIKKVAEIFFKVKAQKKYLDFENSSGISKDEETEGASYQIEIDSIAAYKQNLVNKVMMKISSSPLDDKLIELAVKKAYPGVSNPRNSSYFDIVKSAIKIVCHSKLKDLPAYFESILASFFYNVDRFSGKKHISSDVKSILFIENCKYFFNSPNSKDINILKVRELTAEYLEELSEYYQLHTSADSRRNLRTAVFCYFVYLIYVSAK